MTGTEILIWAGIIIVTTLIVIGFAKFLSAIVELNEYNSNKDKDNSFFFIWWS